MKYRTIQPFIAYGMTPDVGEIVELTTEQADALRELDAIAPYSVKVERPPLETKKKPLESQPVARQSTAQTVKSYGKSVTKLLRSMTHGG